MIYFFMDHWENSLLIFIILDFVNVDNCNRYRCKRLKMARTKVTKGRQITHSGKKPDPHDAKELRSLLLVRSGTSAATIGKILSRVLKTLENKLPNFIKIVWQGWK